MQKHSRYIAFFLIILSILIQCKKQEDGIVRAYLDVPFYITPGQKCYMLDTVSLTPLVRNSVLVEVDNILDNRSTGAACMSSTGGYINVSTNLTINNAGSPSCRQNMNGCLSETDEWNPYTNNNAPKCVLYGSLVLCLLKVEPVSIVPKNKNDYRFKYVFKRPK